MNRAPSAGLATVEPRSAPHPITPAPAAKGVDVTDRLRAYSDVWRSYSLPIDAPDYLPPDRKPS
jgi:hypothetical protein